MHHGLVHVSGQLPIDPASGLVLGGDIESQAERTLRNVEAVLLEAGSSLDQVLSLMIFLTDRADWSGVNAVCERMFGVHRPARAVIGGASLKAGCLIEITAVGAIPDRP